MHKKRSFYRPSTTFGSHDLTIKELKIPIGMLANIKVPTNPKIIGVQTL